MVPVRKLNTVGLCWILIGIPVWAQSERDLPLSSTFQDAVESITLPIFIDNVAFCRDGQKAIVLGHEKVLNPDGSLGSQRPDEKQVLILDLNRGQIVSEKRYTAIKKEFGWTIATSNEYAFVNPPLSKTIEIYSHQEFRPVKQLLLTLPGASPDSWEIIENRFFCFAKKGLRLQPDYHIFDLDKLDEPRPISGLPYHASGRWWLDNIAYSVEDWNPIQIMDRKTYTGIKIPSTYRIPDYRVDQQFPRNIPRGYSVLPGDRIAYKEIIKADRDDSNLFRISILLSELRPAKPIAQVLMLSFDRNGKYRGSKLNLRTNRNVLAYFIGDQLYWLRFERDLLSKFRTPLEIRPIRNQILLDEHSPLVWQFAIQGGTPPYTNVPLFRVDLLDVEQKGKIVTVAVREKRVQREVQKAVERVFRNELQTPDTEQFVRKLQKYHERMNPLFEQLGGNRLEGIPFQINVGVVVRDATGQRAGLSQSFFIDIPEEPLLKELGAAEARYEAAKNRPRSLWELQSRTRQQQQVEMNQKRNRREMKNRQDEARSYFWYLSLGVVVLGHLILVPAGTTAGYSFIARFSTQREKEQLPKYHLKNALKDSCLGLGMAMLFFLACNMFLSETGRYDYSVNFPLEGFFSRQSIWILLIALVVITPLIVTWNFRSRLGKQSSLNAAGMVIVLQMFFIFCYGILMYSQLIQRWFVSSNQL